MIEIGIPGFISYSLIHIDIFNIGVLLITQTGYTWDKRSFVTIWEIGNHFPNLIMYVPLRIISIEPEYTYY